MISQYLLALVESNNRVIVPDFGAFMVQDTANGKVITFNDFLTFNDGLLVNQIIRDKKISKNEALEIIKAFIHEAEQKFNKGEEYKLEGFGYLYKDHQANVKFRQGESQKQEEPKSDDEKKTAIIEIDEKANVDQLKEEKQQEVVTESKPNTPSIELDEAPKKADPPKVEAVNSNKPKTPEKKVEKPKPQVKRNTVVSNKDNKRVNQIIIIASSVVIVGVIGWALYTFNVFGGGEEKVTENVPVEQPVIDTTEVMEADSVVEDTVVEVNEEPEVVEESYVEPEKTEKRYYVIAGSFSVKGNAEQYTEKLNAEGYQSDVIVRTNGYHAVSYYSYVDKQEAFAKWREMRAINPQTWVLIKR